MNKIAKIFMAAVCVLLISPSLSFAVFNNTISFKKNVTYSGNNTSALGTTPTTTDAAYYTIGTDTLYVEFWEAVYYNFAWYCYCCAPNELVRVNSTAVSGGMGADSVNLTLKDYIYTNNITVGIAGIDFFNGTQAQVEANPSKFINANGTGVSLTLCTNTNKTATNSSVLELEDNQTISITNYKSKSSTNCTGQSDSASDNATAYVADDAVSASDIVVRNDTSFSSGDGSGFADGDRIYVQVTDTDENRKGYSAETITGSATSGVRLNSTLSDIEYLNLNETLVSSGVFQNTTGLPLQYATAASTTNNILEVSGGNNFTVTYIDGNVQTAASHTADNVSQSFTTASSLSSFTVSASSNQVACTPFTLTITAKDSNGATVASYTGTVTLTMTYVSPASGTKTISPTTATFSASDNGVKTVSITYCDTGTITITATDTSNITGTSSNIIFCPYDFSLAISGLDTAATGSAYARHTAGKPFTLSVTARDASGSTTPNYRGTTNLTINYSSPSSSQSGSLATSSLTSGYWSSGVATLTSQTYDKWGTISITAADSGCSACSGTSSSIIFLPKDLRLSVSSPNKPSRTYFYPNEDFSCTVTARDYNNSTLTNYQGTITFTASGLVLPSDYTFTTSDSGVHTFTDLLYGTSDTSTSISAKDLTYTSIVSNSQDVTVKTGTVKVISKTSPVGKAAVTVKLLGSSGSVLTEDDSTTFKVKLSEAKADNSASSPTTAIAATFTDGVATIYLTDNEAEKVTVTPTSISQDLSSKAGIVTFGTLKGQNLGIPLWREIRDPGMWRELKEPREKEKK